MGWNGRSFSWVALLGALGVVGACGEGPSDAESLEPVSEEGIAQARRLLRQMEALEPDPDLDAERDLFEQSLVRLGEARMLEKMSGSADETQPAPQRSSEPWRDEAVLRRIEQRRAREAIARRVLQDMEAERRHRLRYDPAYQRERRAELAGVLSGDSVRDPRASRLAASPAALAAATADPSRDELVNERLREEFELSLWERDFARAESLMEDMRTWDPRADLIGEYLALKARREQMALGAGVRQAPGTQPRTPWTTPRAGDRTARDPASRSPAAEGGGRARTAASLPRPSGEEAKVRSMLDGALGKLRGSGPEGARMAEALGAFAASGGRDKAGLEEALSTLQSLRQQSGNTGGSMASMLEGMLTQLLGSGRGGEADVEGVLSGILGSGAGAGGEGLDPKALQDLLENVQRQGGSDGE